MNWRATQFRAGGLILLVAGCASTAPTSTSQGSCTSSPISSACNDLNDIGSVVNPTCAAGDVPTGTGGVIADGTYVLTALIGYHCDDAGGPPPQSQTALVSAGCLQGAGHIDGQPFATTQSFTISGNVLTGTIVCPPGQTGPQTATFTAAGSSLTLFHPSPFDQIGVYARQ